MRRLFNLWPLFRLSIGILLLTILPVSHAADERLGQINPEKVTVNGITILSTEKDIIRILGEPREVEVGLDEPTAEKSKTFYYKGLTIYLIKAEIYNLSCTEKCKTGERITMGDSKDKIIRTYGTPSYEEPKGTSIHYVFTGLDSHLVFHLKNGLIVEIEFFVDYV